VDGITYWCCPQAAGEDTSVYADGYSAGHDPFWPNAGYVICTYDANNVTLEYRRTYLAGTGDPDPSDGIIENDAVVRSLTVPAPDGLSPMKSSGFVELIDVTLELPI
jgi:hypothetical protein